ncbi:uncharacterized protein LOC126846205 [Adelges cooleyi]|uniref:uncharacterized protein LOC126846205 n=1 Tax=Adelges cooleyi TaxID=133065 RepID=UPI0021800B76|nr:uncharacterized protein LOC126846205 [Adelges cooleyi]
MFFKFSILCLYCIVIANCVLGEPEDENETLKNSYDDCRRWLGKSLSSTITIDDFMVYMGKKKIDINIIRDYFQDNKEDLAKQNAINLVLYGTLFKHLCNKKDFDVKLFAEFRKVKSETMKYNEAKALKWADGD